MLSRLGLQPASWLDVVLNQHNDASAWLITYSHHRKSHVIDLGTHPQCRQSSGNAFEHPNLDPMEMLLYGVTGEFYSRSRMLQRADSTPLWTGFFRDEQARVYFVSLANTKHHSFLLDAAQKCPKVLYSPDSPLLPIYDSFSFSPEHDAAIYVSKPPPWPLIQGFVVGQDRHATELRRILERARDLFAHLATLQDYGISLDAQEFGIDWPSSFMYPDRGPWLIPAYLSRAGQADGEGRLLRTGHWEEALPQPHVRPWPVNILKGRSGSSTVPWSQAAAYADARVEGPKTVGATQVCKGSRSEPACCYHLHSQYFYGINSASWNETAAAERRASWSTYNKLYVDMSKARHRHHGDLLAASKDIFSHIFCTRYVAVDKCIKVLTSKSLSTAYECWLAAETATLPPASSSSGRSGLFRACLAVSHALQGYPIDIDLPPSPSLAAISAPSMLMGAPRTTAPLLVLHFFLAPATAALAGATPSPSRLH